MTAIRDLKYKTSRDYAALWELAQRQSVACVVDGQICQTAIAESGRLMAETVDRLYFSGQTAEIFAERAARANLEWIVPPGRDLVSEIAEEIEKRRGRLPIGSAEYMGLRSMANWIAELTAVDPEAGEV